MSAAGAEPSGAATGAAGFAVSAGVSGVPPPQAKAAIAETMSAITASPVQDDRVACGVDMMLLLGPGACRTVSLHSRLACPA